MHSITYFCLVRVFLFRLLRDFWEANIMHTVFCDHRRFVATQLYAVLYL
jgi:hypothetical protein